MSQMARLLLLCLIIAHAFASLASAITKKDEPEEGTTITVEPPSSSALPTGEKGTETGIAEAPMIRKFGKHQHSIDKSVVGGGVILGGLGTMILAAVIWYIRITRRQTEKPGNPV